MENTENQPGVSLAEQALSDMIAELGDELADPKKAEVHRMSEQRFVHVFLPIFAGEQNLYATHGANMHLWQSLAGGPYREVSIVDNAGQELFRVPPLFNMAAMKPLDGTGDASTLNSLADVIARASLIAKQGKERMNNFLAGELQRRDFMFATEKDETEYIQRWNEIFARYNRPLLNISGNGAIIAAPTNKNDNNLCDEYDPA